MKEFYRLLNEAIDIKDEAVALATVIRVEGSAYRHEGAKMLFTEGGSHFGTISAGCLEEDLACRASEVLQSSVSQIITYDLRSEDDLTWGQSAGCNGSIQVYVEPLDGSNPIWNQIKSLLEQGKNVICAKGISGKLQGFFGIYSEEGEVLIESSDLVKLTEIQIYISQWLMNGAKTLEMINIKEFQSEFIFEIYEPKDRLFIFGAGPDVEPLVDLASRLDFDITIIDPRSSRCCKEIFPKANKLIEEHPETYLQRQRIPEKSYVLVMTHNFIRDQKIVQHFLKESPNYLGVLGPRRRTIRLLGTVDLPEWIHSPIGLDIEAEGPEEITVSVMAELIKTRNAFRIYTKRALSNVNTKYEVVI